MQTQLKPHGVNLIRLAVAVAVHIQDAPVGLFEPRFKD